MSDIDGLFFDVGTQFGAQCLVGHKIDATTKQVFEIELDARNMASFLSIRGVCERG
ncbi:MAG: hypothetical protein Q8O52_15785 [Sulfuritalea sp.]|nr:hypothetical protein [Sulfuritalea sp.]